MILARPKAKLDERSGVRNRFALPAMVRLVFPHGFFAGRIPCPGRLSGQVVLTNQSRLNGLRAFGVDLLLPAHPAGLFPPERLLGRGIMHGARRLGRSHGRIVPLVSRSCGRGFFRLRRPLTARTLNGTRRNEGARENERANCAESCASTSSAMKHVKLPATQK
jgi:hypothetical protein